jgi:tRNA pseudouridine55 synthase
MIGLINLLKPPGPTSHDMVNWLRRLLGIRQIGHLGTLDPGAAGVLPICVGPATRLAEYMADWLKKYRVEVLLGVETDSQDFFGKIINNNLNCQLTDDQIAKGLEQLIGQQEQIPPMFSAVKQGGKRLYKLAREGKQVVRKPRSIIIHDIQIQRQLPSKPFSFLELTTPLRSRLSPYRRENLTRLRISIFLPHGNS